ncbi:MAG: 5-formyltetrahydrofolate cyclo-ligase [Flavobacteriales bacterium]|nr:5-formyltetrahydrofolate cyclo-ligase [Flavobacteriales bacterium]
MLKADIRKKFSKVRLGYNTKEMKSFSQSISDAFFSEIDLTGVKNVHAFLPMISKNEIDTQLIVNRLWNEFPNIKTITSESDFETITMKSLLFNNETKFEDDDWGIPTPTDATPFNDNEIDLILVPLLAFDLDGMRVGYGKAFYDKFLANCKPDIIKVGVSILDPVDVIDDVYEHDIPLTCCITPSRFYRFE